MASTPPPGSRGYGAVGKSLHWLIVALVATQFVTAFLLPDIGPHTKPSTIINLHFSFGVTILVVMLVRFIHRLAWPVPLEATGPAWERNLAKLTHGLFYLLLLVGPLLGWASASAHSLPVTVFGLFTMPDIAAPRARWALTAGDIHMYAMWTMLGIIVLHAGAALYHQFIRHDGTLSRMLPGRT